MEEEITTAEIAQHYSAAMDSVRLINEIVASGDTVTRNYRRCV